MLEKQGLYKEAQTEYQNSLKIESDYKYAQESLDKLVKDGKIKNKLMRLRNINIRRESLRRKGIVYLPHYWCDNKSLSIISISYSKIVGGKDRRFI